MGKLVDLVGQKFNRLTVIKRVENDKWGASKWLCECECGNKKNIRGTSLRCGETQSCGCLHNEKMSKLFKLEYGLASMRKAIKGYKWGAKIRGLNYELTEEQFKNITKQSCYFCEAEPSNVSSEKTNNGVYIYNGIDRIDNTRGYTIDNVVSCCHQCNSSKGKLTLTEFKDWIGTVYKKMYKKGSD